jgi:putative membrane protein
MFGISFFVIDKTTPGNFWHEIIEEHNTALSLIFCGFAIGISIIIAAAIGG